LLIDSTVMTLLLGPQNPEQCHFYLAEGCHLYIADTFACRRSAHYGKRCGASRVRAKQRELIGDLADRLRGVWPSLIATDCVFRRIPASDSDANQLVIPIEASHRFRGIPATPE
jgi:hypothetical protein